MEAQCLRQTEEYCSGSCKEVKVLITPNLIRTKRHNTYVGPRRPVGYE